MQDIKKELDCLQKMINETLQVIDTLRIPAPLPAKSREHNLSDNYYGYKECHIEPNWLLKYKQTDDELKLDRTVTHALFGM